MKVIEFEVNSSGTLSIADFHEPQVRSEFYSSLSDSWSESPAHLAEAMAECEPLGWAVHSIYTALRDELLADLGGISRKSGPFKKRTSALTARIKAMPDDPEKGAEAWLLALASSEFKGQVVPEIEKWLDSPPDWGSEDDYLPSHETAQGAALEFFESMDSEDLDIVGVGIVEGEHPGSSYYAAELSDDIDLANKAAIDAGIPVRFRQRKG